MLNCLLDFSKNASILTAPNYNNLYPMEKINMNTLLNTLFSVLFLIHLEVAAATVDVIPEPNQVTCNNGTFTLSSSTVIATDKSQAVNAHLLQAYMKQAAGVDLKIANAAKNVIKLKLNSSLSSLGKEGYNLKIDSNSITITAPTARGIFYGIQTLRQLVMSQFSSAPLKLTGVDISDQPVFAYRGMMLDTGRFYYTPEFIKKFLDIMALQKMNKFHWHFIEDAGWRPEIKKYPNLVKKGAFINPNDKSTGGYYSQKQMKEIVKYAQDRQIDIIPEVELPAHSLSALVAYPFLGCKGSGYILPTKQFISKDIYCVGNPKTLKFLDEVLVEIADIFPGEYIHIGGDEAKYDSWKKCQKCQALKKKLGLNSEKQLQGWLTKRVEKLLAGKGKKIIGWDEILSCGVSKSAALMIWYRKDAAKKGAEKGHDIIMALTSSCYFDTPESKLPGEPPAATWISPVTLKKAYNWDPIPDRLSTEAKGHILGPEGCIWSDQILNHKSLQGRKVSENYVLYLLLPRIAALSEVAWTKKDIRDWGNFQKRMSYMYRIYDKLQYNFRIPLPVVKKESKGSDESVYTFASPVTGGKICYEIGGKVPTASSPVYVKPLTIKNSIGLKAVTVVPESKRCSLVFNTRADAEKYAKYGGEFSGNWSAGKKEKQVKLNLTGKIRSNGEYILTLVQLKGRRQGKTTISKIVILRNGKDKILTINDPITLSTSRKKGTPVTLNIKGYETGASFEAIITISNNKNGSGIAVIRKK